MSCVIFFGCVLLFLRVVTTTQKKCTKHTMSNLTLQRLVGDHENHEFLIPCKSLVLKNLKVHIESQSIVEDLPFPPLILRMNNCISILYREILSISSTRKWLLYHLRVNTMVNLAMVEIVWVHEESCLYEVPRLSF